MAYSDIELAFLLSAHGKKLYSFILEQTKNRKETDQIFQKAFVAIVCFPPASKGEAEQALLRQAKKLCKKITPGSADAPTPQEMEVLEEETYALMKEAREHEGLLPPPLKKWRKVHTVLSAVCFFALVLTVSLIVLLGGKGETYHDEQGSAGDLLTFPSPGQIGSNPQSEPPSQKEPPVVEDPLPFPIINDDTTVTYTALSDFVGALDQKNAPGYGKTYYNTRALLLLPSRLPDDAVFRGLYLNTADGKYSYSFRFNYQKVLYLLEFEADVTLPKNAMAVSDCLTAIRQETTETKIEGATLTATFGADRVIVTLSTPLAKDPIDEKQAKELLSQITIERCSSDNPFLLF